MLIDKDAGLGYNVDRNKEGRRKGKKRIRESSS